MISPLIHILKLIKIVIESAGDVGPIRVGTVPVLLEPDTGADVLPRIGFVGKEFNYSPFPVVPVACVLTCELV